MKLTPGQKISKIEEDYVELEIFLPSFSFAPVVYDVLPHTDFICFACLQNSRRSTSGEKMWLRWHLALAVVVIVVDGVVAVVVGLKIFTWKSP